MYSLRKSLISLASAAALMLLAVVAQASTLGVPSAAYPTIQSAINAANAGDTILVAAGTYSESLDWENKDLTIQGAGAGQSIIDASGSGRACLSTVSLSSASHIEGFTFQNSFGYRGCGMQNEYSSNPTVTNCTFSNNTGYSGGGMYNYSSSSPTVTNCIFSGNVGYGSGGGMYNNTNSNPTVTNCTFSGNSALSSNGSGGGMENYISSPIVVNCTFSGNSAQYAGGGMDNGYQCSPTVVNCTFSGNSAQYYGGGMYNFSSSLTVTNCILWGNSASFGGSGMQSVNSSVNVICSDVQDLSNPSPDTSGNFGADPIFVRNPFTNGTSDYGDLHLQALSPCINIGNNAVVTSPPFLMDPTSTFIIDLDGNPRIKWGTVDLGAYEYQNNLAPIANAGQSQTLQANHSGNPATDTAAVTLDGSASSDPAGSSLTYAWNDGQGDMATGVNPTISLKSGSYTFTLTVTDVYGAMGTATVSVTVTPAPNQAPSANSQSVSLNQDTNAGITLTGSDPDGDSLTYTVSNPADGTLSGTAPNLTYTPNAGYVGSDSFTFTVTDPYGAVSNTATINITVKDTTPPVITLNGSNPMTVTQGSTFTDPGATAVDNVDGTVPVTVSGAVNTALPGSYTLTYSAQDSAGNKASTTRTVNVVAAAPKVTVKLTAIGELLQVVGVVVTIQNGGSTTISNVKITSTRLIDVNALLVAPNGFSLGAGKSADVALAFYPLKKGQKGTLSISGSYAGGTFSLSQNITIP